MPCQDKAEQHLLGRQPSSSIFGTKPHLCSKLNVDFLTSRKVFWKKNIPFVRRTMPLPVTWAAGDKPGSAPTQHQQGTRHCFDLGRRMPRLHRSLRPLAGSRWQSILHFHSSRAWRRARTLLTRDQLLFILHRWLHCRNNTEERFKTYSSTNHFSKQHLGKEHSSENKKEKILQTHVLLANCCHFTNLRL